MSGPSPEHRTAADAFLSKSSYEEHVSRMFAGSGFTRLRSPELKSGPAGPGTGVRVGEGVLRRPGAAVGVGVPSSAPPPPPPPARSAIAATPATATIPTPAA